MTKSTVYCNTWKKKTVAALLAVIGAVALPELFHAIGAISGVGTAMGEIFLPMHIAVLAVGLLAGPVVGGAVGAVSPLFSYALSGMPRLASLPFMMVELCAYGVIMGLVAGRKMPVIGKLLLAQIGGRLMRMAVMAVAFFGFSYGASPVTVVSAIASGLPGLLLQWVLVPLIIYVIEGRKRDK